MSLTEKDREWLKFKKKARKFQKKRVLTYADLQSFLNGLTEWWDKVNKRIEAIEKKQTEFESRLAKIEKKFGGKP